MASLAAKIARYLLILHGVVNIVQGCYCLLYPQGWVDAMGDLFADSPDKAVQSIGLGALGVGWYEFIFALQGSRTLYLSTIPLRLAFAHLTGLYWGWRAGVVKYELGVALLAAMAAYM